jgi:hypothetical protein
MDLKALKPQSDTITVELKHPSTGEPLLNIDDTPMTITVWAAHSKEYKSVIHEAANKRLKKAAKTKNKQVDLTIEEIEQQGLDLAVAVIKDWNITYGEDMPKFSRDLAEEIYKELFWVREQVDEAVESVDVFTQK